MARQLQLRRGTTAQHAGFTGAVGEVTIDTDKDALVVHDGVVAGGIPAARESVVTAHTDSTSNPHSVTKTQVGLGNVDNTSDTNKPVSTAQQSALDLKANLASPTFTGVPNSTTAAVDTNTTQIATTAYVIGNVNNTLTSTSTTRALSAAQGKALQDGKANLASPTFTGTPASTTPASTDSSTRIATTAFAVPRTSTTGSARLPAGTSAQRDASPVDGMIRYNTTTLGFEGYFNGQWQSVGGGQMFGNAAVKAVSYNAQVINENITVTAGLNAYSVGDVTINNGYTMTIENGSVYKIL